MGDCELLPIVRTIQIVHPDRLDYQPLVTNDGAAFVQTIYVDYILVQAGSSCRPAIFIAILPEHFIFQQYILSGLAH